MCYNIIRAFIKILNVVIDMKIKLQGIGIIKDSEIELNGLTVITGDNNSGKTTVGKVVYSLFDAVSDLAEKAESDKNYCAWKTLRDVRDSLDFLAFIFKQNENLNDADSALSVFFTISPAYLRRNNRDLVSFAHKIYDELKQFHDVGLYVMDEGDKHFLHRFIKQRFFKRSMENYSVEDYIENQLSFSLEKLEDLFTLFESDPQMIEYAKRNIFETLKVEFMGQIQPVKQDVEKSLIIAEDDKKTYFYLDIMNNKVINNNEPVYFDSPLRKAFFVDNPFVLDLGDFSYAPEYIAENYNDSFLNRNRIHPHEVKLNKYLRGENATILEANLLEKRLKSINSKINEVISGEFEFTENGDFYVEKGRKLRFSNLATGSKLFSILKILINKGALTESTVLVLDEPEAHLHPSWQNKFAEIIVMLVKELNVKVLLTSHSPNFVLAIDAFMRKYEINDKTNFYQTHLMEDGFAEYVNVNNDMGRIYSDFVQYLTEAKALRNKYMHNLGDNDD